MLKTTLTLSLSVCATLVMLPSCNDTAYLPDPEKDWAGTTSVFAPVEEQGFSTYYTPALGRCGDPMPFYDKKAGEYRVMYLQDYDQNGDSYHLFWCVRTKDGANYTSMGEILHAGAPVEQDAGVGTGCCVYNEADKLYYIYYTGHNAGCAQTEAVLRATSTDGVNFKKDILWMLKGENYGFDATDFRDPQIFQGDDNLWHMVVSSKLKFAEFTSKDLKVWEPAGGFNMVWDRMCECPDIFKMGNYWYLIYSEAYKESWSRKVKYMMADSWENLKRCFDDPGAHWPADDKEGVLDTRAFYAAKTASNGSERLIWGWCPTRDGADLYAKNVNVGAGKGNEPKWSGSLVCHKLVQHPNGTLSVGKVAAIENKYSIPTTVTVMDSKGLKGNKLSGDEAYVIYNRLGYHNHISFTVKTDGEGDRFGVSFVRGKKEDCSKYYSLVVTPEWENGRRRVYFQEEFYPTKDEPFIQEKRIEATEGYIFPRDEQNTYKIDIFTDNSVVTMYVNGVYGCTERIYGVQKNCWSINNYGGNITISNVSVTQY